MPAAALPLLILGFPALGAVLLAGRGWRLPRPFTVVVGPGAVWLAFAVTVYALLTDQRGDFTYWTWIAVGGFQAPANLLLDHLSTFMCLVITGVGGLIVTYSVGYMTHENDAGYARFFCYMDLFVFSMLVLVLAGNFVFLTVGWALVGLSSYLLIGFYYWRLSAVLAARKAFVMNVIGDIGLILGTFVVFFDSKATTFAGFFQHLGGRSDTGSLELAGFLFLVGAVAKSAQLPLHTWLPDAMEGPTPVSALIHAATMVTAGVYLVGRLHPLYDIAVYAHGAVAVIGAASAFLAATIAIVQTDIKRVLAYSTMSQIGYMFLAVGIGAYGAGFFHLLSHAFFKALLFMAAGNVIHAMDDDQDLRHYGGLWHGVRATSICFLVGSLSLVGLIPLVGFFSKEYILGSAFSFGPGSLAFGLWVVGFATALLTGFYTGRMWWLGFWGRPSASRPVEHPHEAPGVMLLPVAALTLLTLAGGFLQMNAIGVKVQLVGDYLAPVLGRPAEAAAGGGAELAVTALTVAIAVALFALAYGWYGRREGGWATWARRLPRGQAFLEHKWYFDELYDALFVRPLDALAAAGERFFDRPVVEGSLTGVGTALQDGAGGLSLVQNGYLRAYAVVFVGGAVVAAAVVLWRAGVL